MTPTAAAELSKAVETVVLESARKDALITELQQRVRELEEDRDYWRDESIRHRAYRRTREAV